MAFQTGTQIRPELADADYSGFVNAANIRAQAMMNLGEQIGSGIREYQKNKEIKGELTGQIEGSLTADPSLLASLQQLDDVSASVKKMQEGNANKKDLLMIQGAIGSIQNIKLHSIQEQLEQNKLSLAQRQEARLEKTGEAEINLAQDRAALAQEELDLKQRIFEAEQKGDPVAAQQAQAELDKTKAQTQEIEARTKAIGQVEKEEDALSTSEIMKTQQLMEDLDVYYDDEKNKFMLKGGLPGSWGDKELTKGSNAYMQIAATKGGRALLKQASPVLSEEGTSGEYKKGERREQNGVVYEYDGTKFNPVN
jgi:DNA mismatch repair ATPase MutS